MVACAFAVLLNGCCIGGSGPTGIGGGVCLPVPRFMRLWGAVPAAAYTGICAFKLESEERIVLAGIHCPEQDAYMGAEAWAATHELLTPGARVHVRPVGGDSYLGLSMGAGETRAYVHTADGRFVNEALVRRGFATVVEDEGLPDLATLRAAERAARRAQRGLWYAGAPLMRAVRRRDLAAVQALLAAGADANASDPTGNTPLMLAHLSAEPAGQTCDPALIEMLLASGADPEIWGGVDRAIDAMRTYACPLSELHRQGRARAFVAAARRGPEAVSALVHRGWDLNRANVYGSTPLTVAASLNEPGAIAVLISAGADLHGGAGEAIASAIRSGGVEALGALIAAGADVNARDRHRQTPLSNADERRRQSLSVEERARNAEIIALLRAAGAGTGSP